MSFKDILRRRARKSVAPSALTRLSPYEIILKPIITEKAYKQAEDANIYMFRVHQDANKNDVKQAVEHVYKVKPRSVRMQRVPFKGRMQRKTVRRAYKKAIISLNKGDKIDLAA